jgi:hypothetical protein
LRGGNPVEVHPLSFGVSPSVARDPSSKLGEFPDDGQQPPPDGFGVAGGVDKFLNFEKFFAHSGKQVTAPDHVVEVTQFDHTFL